MRSMGRALGADPNASLAHAPACAANASDLGLMLAWSRLVGDWVEAEEKVLVVCDDPWMFRHLLAQGARAGGRPPPLWSRALVLWLRGFAARTRTAIRLGLTAMRLRRHRVRYPKGAPAILVYGHPSSTAAGDDGYFGGLMATVPELMRVLHVDCGPGRASALAAHERTVSLHAWGNLWAALALPWMRWRPSPAHQAGPYGWLVRRAAALEGGTGQAAMIRWQHLCGRAWLADAAPSAVAWPWENHAWERAFVRHARATGVRTVGYLHATVGRGELNYSPASNPDGLESIPDIILTNGPAAHARLRAYGYPEARLVDGGAWRYSAMPRLRHDPAGPVFVALPFDADIAAQMTAAIRPLAAGGRRFVVKDHPMEPFSFSEQPGMVSTDQPLAEHHGLAAVLYAATTVGLEAVLAGLPTIRFQPTGKVPTDPVPENIPLPGASAETIEAALRAPAPPPSISHDDVFSPPHAEVWRRVLGDGPDAKAET